MKHLKGFNESISDLEKLEIERSYKKKEEKLFTKSDMIKFATDFYSEYEKEEVGSAKAFIDEWIEDNTVKPEKATFTTLSKEDKEQMMIDAIRMGESEWMKKYKVGDHGDYLNMAKNKWRM